MILNWNLDFNGGNVVWNTLEDIDLKIPGQDLLQVEYDYFLLEVGFYDNFYRISIMNNYFGKDYDGSKLIFYDREKLFTNIYCFSEEDLHAQLIRVIDVYPKLFKKIKLKEVFT